MTPKSWHDANRKALGLPPDWGQPFRKHPDARTHAFTPEGRCIFDGKPLDEHSGEVIDRRFA